MGYWVKISELHTYSTNIQLNKMYFEYRAESNNEDNIQ